ncbi:hypothetical protein vseg_015603 [Gypsophila vaccaria]
MSSPLQLANPAEPSSPLTLVTFSNCIQLKDTMTFRQWRFQVRAIMNGLQLFSYLDGTNPPPPTTITKDPTPPATTPTTIDNPAYSTWYRQDQLILGALTGTLSSPIAGLIVNDTTSRDAWSTLIRTFANSSRGHRLQIKDRLENISHTDDMSITDYMMAIKACTDDLAQLEHPMDVDDITNKILNGLHQEKYRSVIDAVRARDNPISFESLHEKLIQHELRTKNTPPVTTFPPSANAVSYRQNNQNRYNNHNNQNRYNNQTRSSYPPKSAAPLLPNPQQSTYKNPYKGRCHYCDHVGHVTSDCRDFLARYPNVVFPTRQPRGPRPQANTAASSSTAPPRSWVVDSGASHHITDDLNTLSIHSSYEGPDDLYIGDGSPLQITHTGSFTILSHSSPPLSFNNVLVVPKISRKLFSVSQFCYDNNASATFLHSSFSIKDIRTGKLLLHGPLIDGMYVWTPSLPHANIALTPGQSSWHHRLGHPSNKIFQLLNSRLKLSTSHFDQCIACHINKSHKLSFSTSSLISTAPLDLVFSDVWTSPILSPESYKYYVVFIDHFTHYIWLYPIKQKSDTTPTFLKFRAIVEKYFNKPIRQFYSDNGGEFVKLTHHLQAHGITHLTSPPHTPEHNGFAERRHRHIVETGLSLLTHAKLPISFWHHAFTTATYLINRLPTPTLQNHSPYFSLFEKEPNIHKLHSFGCLCFPWLRPYTTHKLQPRSIQCVFLGYSLTQSAYLCLDPLTSRIYTSRHVRFLDDEFPYSRLLNLTSPPSYISPTTWCPLTVPIVSPPLPHSPTLPPPSSPSIAHTPPAPTSHTSTTVTIPSTTTNTSNILPPSHHATRLSNNIRKPNPKYAQVTSLPTSYITPNTVKQALIDPLWRAAMQAEFDALTRNSTWTLVPPSTSCNVIGCKWVFRIKYNLDGTLKQHKARLVAKGFHQRPGLDYSETFSPVIKPTTIRLILSLAVTNGWSMRQIDINNAFLQGTLTDSVYMVQPPGFANSATPDYVCKLSKAIYGLKQAPRAWYTELKKYFLSYGFTNSISDSSLFIYNRSNTRLFALVYVDDIIVTGPNPSDISKFIIAISTRFSLKDLGPLSYFLGMEVTPTSSGLHLNQSKYVSDLLARYNMLDCSPATSPMLSHPPLTRTDDQPLQDATNYRAIVGSLQYLSLTRPDIAYPVNKLAQFLTHPTAVHWCALKRLLRFLKGSLHHGIYLHKHNPFDLHAYCDADWAGDRDDYLSTTGYIVFIGQHPVSWSSKKQRALSRSSTEAEFRAIADTTSELLWLKSLLSELNIPVNKPPTIFCDNLGATNYSANPIFHSRMKHLALAFHFVREQVQSRTIRIQHVNGDDQIADTLTKPLAKPRFMLLASKIGLTLRPSILREHVKDTQSVNTTLKSNVQHTSHT